MRREGINHLHSLPPSHNIPAKKNLMDLDLNTLTALRVLGRGAMGTVFLVKSSSSSSPPFVLKVVDKNDPKSKPDSDRRARWELSVLSRLSHPFLPSLIGSLETPTLFAYAFPFCPGGDLNSLRYSLSDAVFSPSAIKFYLSEILSALSYLHSSNIIYRDLKPENILISSDGHVVLSDFDLSKYLPTNDTENHRPAPPVGPAHRRNLTRNILGTNDIGFNYLKKTKSARVSPVTRKRSYVGSPMLHKSHSFVGTEEYVAPEIIRGEGHEFSVDFWGLGILTYEMAYGKTPFKGRNRKETFRNVLMRQPEFIGRQATELTDLIGRLLAKDPAKRLGFRGGAEEVKKHPFFRGVMWEMLSEVSRPPFFAKAEELEEAVGLPEGDGCGFDIRDYFEKIHSPAPQAESR